MGKEKNHLRFRAVQGSGQIGVIAFNFASLFESIDIINDFFDIAYELHLNSWNGREKLELRLLDIKASE